MKAMEATAPSPMITPQMVGRASQLASLHVLVEQTQGGEGHIALISGEAGIGKSRLVAEVKSYAATRGFLVLQGNCFPKDVSYPYAPLLDLLRSLFASYRAVTYAAGEQATRATQSPRLRPTRVPSPHQTAPAPTEYSRFTMESLERLAVDIFPLLPELVAEPMAPVVSLDPEQEKHRLFAVLANFFLQLSASSPLLVIMEDVHWSDSTSLDFLHYFGRRIGAHPLLLLMTYRREEMRAELSSWLALLKRERLAQEVQLAPLSRSDVDLMLSALFDPQHTSFDMRRFLHGELLETLYTLTEGNPFFVEETLSAMIAAGDIYYVQGYWNRQSLQAAHIPQSVQDAVQQRTQQLGEGAKQVLTLAAVAGRHFDFVLLQQLTRYDEQQLILILKALVAAHLVVEQSNEQFGFRHALTRRAIYTQLLARERSLLHRTIAETIEQYSPTTRDAYLEDLAYHFYQARAWQKAYEYAQRAGEKVLGLYSHRAAIDYFTWALEAADHLSLPPSPSFYRKRGQAYETLGEFEQALHDYTQALDAARVTNDRVAEWQSAIDLGFLWAERDYRNTEQWFRKALELAQELDDPALSARSLNRIGNWNLNVEQPHEALRYHQEALTIFQELHDKSGIAETLDLMGMASILGGKLIQGTDYYRRAIALFHELGDKPGLISSKSTINLASPTFQTDSMVSAIRLATARQEIEGAIKITREMGHRSGEAYALLQLGLCLGSQGEYGHALEATRQGLHIAEEIEHRQWQTAAHALMGGIYNGLCALSQAREHCEQALALAQEIGSLVWKRLATGYLASTLILSHDLTQAEKILDAEISLDTTAQTQAQRLMWCAVVELALARRQPGRALEAIEQLSLAGEKTAEGQNGLRVLKLRGEALAALQRPVEAEEALRAAQAMSVTEGARPRQWRIGVVLGNLYQAQGRNTEAEQAFAAARMVIEELATTIADEPLRENFLQQAMVMLPQTRPLSAKHAAKQAFGGLTGREREVAALIAQGKINREIADILVVSERTVETHVSNIMFKLDFTSRRQIAAWAVERGLTAKG